MVRFKNLIRSDCETRVSFGANDDLLHGHMNSREVLSIFHFLNAYLDSKEAYAQCDHLIIETCTFTLRLL